MPSDKAGLVRRQNGPDLIIYDDGMEPRCIQAGEWVSAVDEIANLPKLGEPESLPPGSTLRVGPFKKCGKSVSIFCTPDSKRVQAALNDTPAQDTPERPGELARFRTEEEDTSPVGVVICDRNLEIGSTCVRSIFKQGNISDVVSDLPASVNWCFAVVSGEPREGEFLSAVEMLDRSTADLIRVSCGVIGRVGFVKRIVANNTSVRAPDLPKLAAEIGAVTIDKHGKKIRIEGVEIVKGRPKKSPVAVVVTVHNAWRAASMCLRSLAAMDFGGDLNPRVIVVDDCSLPYVSEKLKAICKENKWTVITHKKRMGYTRSVNDGIEKVVKSCEWIAILNSDTLVTPGWLYRMVRAGESDQRIGLVGPYSNAAVHLSVPQWVMRGEDPVSIAEKFAFTSKRLYPEALTPTGFCLLLSRKAWKKYGPFDYETYGEAYGEETEFWAQLVSDGGRAVLADDAFVWHQGHASYGQTQGHVAEGKAVKIFRERHGKLLEERAREFNAKSKETLFYQSARLPSGVCSTRPRICFFFHEYGLYGGVLAIANIVNRLIVMGWDARFAVRNVQAKAMNALPVLTHPIPFGSKAILMNHFASEVFKSGILCATVWDTAIPVAEIAKKTEGIKTAYFVQDDESTFSDADGNRFVAEGPVIESYRQIDKKIINSIWVKDKIEKQHGVSGCVYIPVGVDTALFHPRPRADDAPTALFFTRPETPRRGCDVVLKVCSELTSRYPDLRLITYGGLVADMPTSVEQLGTIPQEKVAEVYSQADVFLEASHTQGFGLQGLEAMASGCALVSTKNKGIDNYGKRGENCLLIDIGDSEAAVNSIVELIQNDGKRQALINAGYATAERFDWWRIAEHWDAELRPMVNG